MNCGTPITWVTLAVSRIDRERALLSLSDEEAAEVQRSFVACRVLRSSERRAWKLLRWPGLETGSAAETAIQDGDQRQLWLVEIRRPAAAYSGRHARIDYQPERLPPWHIGTREFAPMELADPSTIFPHDPDVAPDMYPVGTATEARLRGLRSRPTESYGRSWAGSKYLMRLAAEADERANLRSAQAVCDGRRQHGKRRLQKLLRMLGSQRTTAPHAYRGEQNLTAADKAR